MKRIPLNIAFLLFIALCSCSSGVSQREVKHIQRTLEKQEQKALLLTEQLAGQLQGNSFDSVWNITQANQENILFYIFDSKRMVYWSDNWLAGDEVMLNRYNTWYYQQFSNALAVCRWTRVSPYNILTIIPVKYAYSIENEELPNGFIYPFKASSSVTCTYNRRLTDTQIISPDNQYLFSLAVSDSTQQPRKEDTKLSQSFSYRNLLGDDATQKKSNVRLYFTIEIIIFVLLIILGIFGLIRSRGFSNMKLQFKFLYISITLLLFVSIYIFFISTMHVRQRYEKQQAEALRQKTIYIQKALQDMYFWNITLNERNASGMNIDLRDLSYTYETDIHVYDMQGNLVGTSAPMLFENGLISRHIAPEPFFAAQTTGLRDEHIGDLNYLAAYTEFYNGNYVQIGYISVPLYISSDAVEEEVDNFLSKLLPPNIIVLLLAFILNFFITRSLTQPLSVLSEKMRNFRIGQHGNRLLYDKQDEVGQLVKRYNEMVEELEHSSERLARSEREGAWRTMARQIAHEINNPLTPMKLTIQQLQRAKRAGNEKRFDEYFDRSTALLIEQIDHLSHIAQSFSQFAKMPEVEVKKVDVATRLCSCIALFRQNKEQVPIRYIGAQNSVFALTDPEQINQVFNNIIKNALQAIADKQDGDVIVILTETTDKVEVSVSDNGCGIPQDIQEKIFRPNFTTKNTGMGLGLAISKNIIEGSDGRISFTTSDKGTTFLIELNKPRQ